MCTLAFLPCPILLDFFGVCRIEVSLPLVVLIWVSLANVDFPSDILFLPKLSNSGRCDVSTDACVLMLSLLVSPVAGFSPLEVFILLVPMFKLQLALIHSLYWLLASCQLEISLQRLSSWPILHRWSRELGAFPIWRWSMIFLHPC